MTTENDRASSTGTVVGILIAVALVVLVFGTYTYLNDNGATQTTATQQTVPAPETTPTPPANTTPENPTQPSSSTPQASPDSNPPKDGESSSQNAK